jgi:triosephosphate isomerase
MHKYTIAGNWKMNASKSNTDTLLQNIKNGIAGVNNVDWIVFPPFPFLEQVERLLTGTTILWGAQNFSDKPSGAYTGEVSANMLKEFGCSHVLVGHSERRQIYGETDSVIAAKFVAAINAGIKPILCIGETLQEREQGLTMQVVDRQLAAILQLNNGIELFNNANIAYEPVWAIGTGVTATPEQAQEVHAHIRSQLNKYNVEIAKRTKILYGGSVKADNAKELFEMPDINGGLVGGASLKAEEFLGIGKACNS